MTHQTIEIQAGLAVAVIWLNRPEVRNAFNETMIAELTAAFGELERDPTVRAVVLAGRGKVFCAGADLNWMKRMGELDFDENRKDALAFGTMLYRLHARATVGFASACTAQRSRGAWGSLPLATSRSRPPTPSSACPKYAWASPRPLSAPMFSPQWANAPPAAISSPPSAFRLRKRIASASCRNLRSPRSWMRR